MCMTANFMQKLENLQSFMIITLWKIQNIFKYKNYHNIIQVFLLIYNYTIQCEIS